MTDFNRFDRRSALTLAFESGAHAAPLFGHSVAGAPVDHIGELTTEYILPTSAAYAPAARPLSDALADSCMAELRQLRKFVDETDWQFVDDVALSALDQANASDAAAIAAPLCKPATKRPERAENARTR